MPAKMKMTNEKGQKWFFIILQSKVSVQYWKYFSTISTWWNALHPLYWRLTKELKAFSALFKPDPSNGVHFFKLSFLLQKLFVFTNCTNFDKQYWYSYSNYTYEVDELNFLYFFNQTQIIQIRSTF